MREVSSLDPLVRKRREIMRPDPTMCCLPAGRHVCAAAFLGGFCQSHFRPAAGRAGACQTSSGHHHSGARRRTGSACPVSRGASCRIVRSSPVKRSSRMAPYSPPTGDRFRKCGSISTRIRSDVRRASSNFFARIYRRTAFGVSRLRRREEKLSEFFGVAPGELLLTNGTDEAIQVLINTYVDDGDEVVILRPSYAMYRFYAEVAGRADRRSGLCSAEAGVPAGTVTRARSRPDTKADTDLESRIILPGRRSASPADRTDPAARRARCCLDR